MRAGTATTEYTRSGTGPTVVLLAPSGLDHPVWSAITGAATRRLRVIAPDRFPSDQRFASWLRSFLDGLGLARVSLVAEAEIGIRVIGFALAQPERIQRLVVLTDSDEHDTPPGRLAGSLPEYPHPLLFLSWDRPRVEITERLLEFLAGEADPAP